jgi:uncharacterized protein YhbP (UPF0306 family)
MKFKIKGKNGHKIEKKKKPVVSENPEPLSEDEELVAKAASKIESEVSEEAPALDLDQAPLNDFEQDVLKFLKLKEVISEASEQAEKLKEAIKSYVRDVGDVDSKGNRFIYVVIEGNRHIVLLERRVSSRLNEAKTLSLLRGKNLEYCIEVVEKVNENALQDAYNKGEVTDSEMKDLVISSESYALKVMEDKKNESSQ